MKKIVFILLSFSLIISCKKKENEIIENEAIPFASVTVDNIFSDSISIRAIVMDSGKIWYAGNKGKYGYFDLNSSKDFNGHVAKDTFKLEFRSIAKTSSHIFILNVGSPALLYRISKDGSEIKLVYQEKHEKVFYDSMQFWNDKEGIAMGDPTDDCLSIIVTRDGGSTWQKLPCDKLPKIEEGEAAFAASNTNLIIKGNDTRMVSGGKKARVFYSADKGNTWEVFNTPIVQGEAMTGIFTADFYDSKNGIIAGGNYEKPNQNFGNKAITSNGGKTWRLIAEKKGFGYASCVQYIPNSQGKQLVSVGASGLYYSADAGENWKEFLSDKDLFTIRFLNDSTAIAAGKNKIIKVNFKR